MNLSELNVKEEWAYYNKVAPFQTYLLNGNELKYRYYKKDDAKATIVVLAGGSGLADGFFLFLRSYGGLLAQIIAKKHLDVVSGLLLTSTASFSTELTFAGMKCIVNMINEEKEEKRVEKYKKMPMGLAMAMFPMMFKPHLKGDKRHIRQSKN